ncbi:hypothetical protein NDN08_007477 [Rhodosorus marinus]|uniref:BioF2-like acetyltransferase domain-containing protein n=1 Tax=Rhodosorus marinus TaxID=101924 RepID=A0AAV8V0I1_9RHOD|nr:hypothetical protein NDN08_007477 [Rhodosorus marinus]
MYGFLCLPLAGSRRFDGYRTSCQRRRHVLKSSQGKSANYDVKLLRGIDEVDAYEWDALVGESGSPFLEHEWIRCMEKSSCASEKSGWYPRHLTAKMDGKLVAAVPLYIKTNSLGEFVFDQSWAEAAYGSGIQYYPKLLCGIPFTPATGRRLLTHPEEDRQELLNFLAYRLLNLTSESNGVSSLHVNFCEEDEVIALKKTGFLHRKGIQYHFVNEDEGRNPLFNSFDEYLGSMKSKRRIKVKRERRSIYEDAGLTLKAFFGDEIEDEMFPTMFKIYQSTIQAKIFWGIQHLNEDFFMMLKEKFRKKLCFIVAMKGDEVVAGTFNVVKAGKFYGRYWGTFDSSIKNLHFETCYYKPIEVCCDHGMLRMEPGAGGDDFKFVRGFNPSVTNSMHFCKNGGLHMAIARYLNSEGTYIEGAVDEMNERSVLRMPSNAGGQEPPEL